VAIHTLGHGDNPAGDIPAEAMADPGDAAGQNHLAGKKKPEHVADKGCRREPAQGMLGLPVHEGVSKTGKHIGPPSMQGKSIFRGKCIVYVLVPGPSRVRGAYGPRVTRPQEAPFFGKNVS
jgi:hypothetical protein